MVGGGEGEKNLAAGLDLSVMAHLFESSASRNLHCFGCLFEKEKDGGLGPPRPRGGEQERRKFLELLFLTQATRHLEISTAPRSGHREMPGPPNLRSSTVS